MEEEKTRVNPEAPLNIRLKEFRLEQIRIGI
jgi:hypothetical protein